MQQKLTHYKSTTLKILKKKFFFKEKLLQIGISRVSSWDWDRAGWSECTDPWTRAPPCSAEPRGGWGRGAPGGVGLASQEGQALCPISTPQEVPGWAAWTQKASQGGGGDQQEKEPDFLLIKHRRNTAFLTLATVFCCCFGVAGGN